jgi:hypothetical protein
MIFPTRKAKNFCDKGWTAFGDLSVGQFPTRYAFKLSNVGLELMIGLIAGCHRRIAALPCAQRSEPMADG